MKVEVGDSVILMTEGDWRSSLIGKVNKYNEGLVTVQWEGVAAMSLHPQEELYLLDKEMRPPPYIHLNREFSAKKKKKKKDGSDFIPPDPGGGWSDVKQRDHLKSARLGVVARVMSVGVVYTGDRQHDRRRHNRSLDVAYHEGENVFWLLITAQSWVDNQWRILTDGEVKQYMDDLYQLNAEF